MLNEPTIIIPPEIYEKDRDIRRCENIECLQYQLENIQKIVPQYIEKDEYSMTEETWIKEETESIIQSLLYALEDEL